MLAAVCVAASVLAGCTKDGNGRFTVSQNSDLILDMSEHTATVNVFAPAAWTVACDADWVSITPSNGSFAMKVEANAVAASRTASVSVVCQDEVHIFKVVQAAADEVFVAYEYVDGKKGDAIEDGKKYSADAHGQSLSFMIESNCPNLLPPCEIDSEPEWITYSIDNNIVKIDIAPNFECKVRNGSLKLVSTSGAKEITVNFEQDFLELVENITFTAPDMISYNVKGEAGVDYFTGLFDSKQFKNHARNMFQDLNVAFYDALPVRGASPGDGPVFTTSDPEKTIIYTGATAAFFYNFMDGQPIKAGGTYLICVCRKVDAENWDEDAPFYAVEFTVPVEEGTPITAQPPVLDEEE